MQIIKTPLVLFTFNRPDNLQLQLDAIRDFYFEKIYFISDGPNSQNDISGISECRAKIRKIDNYKELVLFENSENWGCKRNFLSNLERIFQNEEKIIVLEDDCIPLPTFFQFCEWSLKYYENNNEIKLVSGSNLLDFISDEKYRCNFSQYINIWGWAGWRDKTWNILNPYLSISSLDILNDENLKFKELNYLEQIYWKSIFKHSIYSHKIWDFYLQFGFFKSNGLSVYPAKNLIKNIGFGEDATHTKYTPEYVIKSATNIKSKHILDLDPPVNILVNKDRDRKVLREIWGFSLFNLLKIYFMNILRFINV